jgi:uncharacterized OB-fold protein
MSLSDAVQDRNLVDRPAIDRDAGTLRGTVCRACGLRSWPGRAICHRCGSPDGIDVDLEQTGTLLSFTTVHVARPNIPAPYTLGQVRLGEDVIVHAHVHDLGAEAVVPMPVQLVVAPDPLHVPALWFAPA